MPTMFTNVMRYMVDMSRGFLMGMRCEGLFTRARTNTHRQGSHCWWRVHSPSPRQHVHRCSSLLEAALKLLDHLKHVAPVAWDCKRHSMLDVCAKDISGLNQNTKLNTLFNKYLPGMCTNCIHDLLSQIFTKWPSNFMLSSRWPYHVLNS